MYYSLGRYRVVSNSGRQPATQKSGLPRIADFIAVREMLISPLRARRDVKNNQGNANRKERILTGYSGRLLVTLSIGYLIVQLGRKFFRRCSP